MSEALKDEFIERATSVEDLFAKGWYVERSSGGSWWFRHKETQRRQPVPLWVRQMVFDARKDGEASAKEGMRLALGLKKRNNPPAREEGE